MFSKRLKALRNEKGVTQQELADAINISRSTIAGYEIDGKQPSYEVIGKLANFFSVSTDYLLGREDSSQRNGEESDFFFFFFDNQLREVFKLRFKKALEDRGMNIRDFSEVSNIGLKICENYLEGEIEPSLENLIIMSHTLEVSVDYLLGLSPKLSYYENKILGPFVKLNMDNKDIIIGKAKELLREQEFEESVAAEEEPLKKASGK